MAAKAAIFICALEGERATTPFAYNGGFRSHQES